jgi:hypothetical protein
MAAASQRRRHPFGDLVKCRAAGFVGSLSCKPRVGAGLEHTQGFNTGIDDGRRCGDAGETSGPHPLAVRLAPIDPAEGLSHLRLCDRPRDAGEPLIYLLAG